MTVTVSGFSEQLGDLDCPVVSAAVAYDDEMTLTTYILIFNQVLYIPSMHHNLVSPFQLRMNDLIVNDTPLRVLAMSNDLRQIDSTAHSILTPDPHLHIPLRLRGTISYFNTRKPTREELEDEQKCPRVIMTYQSPVWDPHDNLLDQEEDKLREQLTTLLEVPTMRDRRIGSLAVAMLETITIADVDMTKTIRRKGTVSVDELAKRWHISLDVAQRTLDKTTQKGVRDYTHMKGSRRLRHLTQQLAYRPLNAVCYTDTMFSRIPSLTNKYTCAQVFCTDFEWVKIYPMRQKSEAHLTLDMLHHQYGAFRVMIPDNAKELTEGAFRDKLRRAGTIIAPIEAYTPNQNRAESSIRELKRMYRRAMISSKAPEVLWDHCFQLMAEIRSHTSLQMLRLDGEAPLTRLTGDTADISHLCQFEWYQYVWWLDVTDSLQNRKLGRYLGPSLTVGDVMCQKVLTSKATVRVHSSVFPLTIEDENSEIVKGRKEQFEKELTLKLRERAAGLEPLPEEIQDEDEITPEFELYEDNDGNTQTGMPEIDDFDEEAYDKFISAHVMLPDEEGLLRKAKVKERKRDAEGHIIGKSNKNPILNTGLYEVEFEDGSHGTYTANIIAENIYQQVDDEGNEFVLFDSIVDHKKNDSAITNEDGFIERFGKKILKKTTRGWKMCVMWKDGSTSWVHLKDLKESHPIQVAEYAVAKGIADEPAFAWWVKYVIKKRNRIISAITKTKYARTTSKYGIELPHTVQRALEIDRETNTDFWEQAIKKEMGTVNPALEILPDGSIAPVGYQKIPCHIVFDVKMDLTRKARFVAGGHKTEPPASITYASVVSRESVRIAFLVAALNDLDILAADVQGAYLNAPCKEKVYTICGPEFGQFQGRIAVIRLALYGLKSSGFAWRSHLAFTLRSIGFEMCYADNDVWLRPAVDAQGTRYYEYVLVYTDDILAVSKDPKAILGLLDQNYLLKPDSIGPPKRYLGAKIGRYEIEGDPKPKWTMSPEEYTKAQLRQLDEWLDDNGYAPLTKKAPSVLPTNYRPEMDASDYLDSELTHFYQTKIGVLRWIVELGQINITAEVSMLAAYTTAPRKGHLNAVLHIFAFLRGHARNRLVFDDSYVAMPTSTESDFSEFYPEAQEELPPNAPEALGKAVQIIAFSDSDHAGDTVTRRSRTGVLIYLNRAPIIWHSKKQTSIETSTFGSEFMALKTCTDLVKGLRYKLRMMGIPLEGPAHIRVDNMSVVNNTTRPESVLKKKSNSIAYHYVRENVAAKVIQIGYEPTESNLADMLTKIQSGPVRSRLAQQVLY